VEQASSRAGVKATAPARPRSIARRLTGDASESDSDDDRVFESSISYPPENGAIEQKGTGPDRLSAGPIKLSSALEHEAPWNALTYVRLRVHPCAAARRRSHG